jgi:hypothetical protein
VSVPGLVGRFPRRRQLSSTEPSASIDANQSRHRVGELQPDGQEVESPWVLGIWNESGGGLALEGDRGELPAFAAALHGFIERETSPLPALRRALTELHTLQKQRNAALDAGEHSRVCKLEEQEVTLLYNVADVASEVADLL